MPSADWKQSPGHCKQKLTSLCKSSTCTNLGKTNPFKGLATFMWLSHSITTSHPHLVTLTWFEHVACQNAFTRTLTAAIICHADQHWTDALPLVFLRIRTSFKVDLQASVAELVYCKPLHIPGELLTSTVDPVDPAPFITQLHLHVVCLWPVPAACHLHSSGPPYLHACLSGRDSPVSGAPLQQAQPGPLLERRNAAAPGAW
jgi:hypothetical protein